MESTDKSGWGLVNRFFLEIVAISFFVCIFLYATAELSANGRSFTFVNGVAGTGRAWIYFFCMYVAVIPLYFVRVRKALSSHAGPTHSLSGKILYTVLALALLPLMIGAGPLLLALGGDAIGRSHLAYLLLSRTFTGLALLGALFSYGAVLCAWMLLVALPSMWKK